jgi:hypothetical protein
VAVCTINGTGVLFLIRHVEHSGRGFLPHERWISIHLPLPNMALSLLLDRIRLNKIQQIRSEALLLGSGGASCIYTYIRRDNDSLYTEMSVPSVVG